MRAVTVLVAVSGAWGSVMARPHLTLAQDASLVQHTSLQYVTTLEMLRIQVAEAQLICGQVPEAEAPLAEAAARRAALVPKGSEWLASARARAVRILGKTKADAEHVESLQQQTALLDRVRRSTDKRLRPTLASCMEAADRLTLEMQEMEDFFPLPPDRIK